MEKSPHLPQIAAEKKKRRNKPPEQKQKCLHFKERRIKDQSTLLTINMEVKTLPNQGILAWATNGALIPCWEHCSGRPSHELNVYQYLLRTMQGMSGQMHHPCLVPKKGPVFPRSLSLTHIPHTEWLEIWGFGEWVNRLQMPTYYFHCKTGHSSLDHLPKELRWSVVHFGSYDPNHNHF